MTTMPVARRWWRLTRRSLIASLVALAIGVGIGLLVQIVSPNPTYGLQIEAIGLALLMAIVVAVVPRLRRLLPVALGLAVGVVVGIGVGPKPTALPFFVGTLEVHLGLPVTMQASTAADCRVADGKLEFLMSAPEGALRLPDGRWFAISLGPADQEPTAPDRPFDIEVIIFSTTSDGTPTETRMASDASSTISISNAGATGSMAFSGLVVHHQSGLKEPIDVAGTLTWSCPA